MLVRFKVENWKSFHCLDFSMIASRKTLFNERVVRLKKYRLRLLPISAVFGGNASGKTNFFEALVFLQKLVRGDGVVEDKIDVKPFAFNKEDREKPVSFEIEFLVDSKIYHYEVQASYEEIVFERLAEVSPDGDLKDYFVRNRRDIELIGEYRRLELENVTYGTWKKVLFLTNSIQQDCEEFRAIYNWFNETLLLISPTFRFLPSPQLLQPECRELLEQFDVGFDELAEVDMTFEQTSQDILNKLDVPKERREQVREGLITAFSTLAKNLFIDSKEVPNKTKKLVSIHTSDDDLEKIPFALEEESDGTRRLLDILPALVRLRNSFQPSVVFIDELDRNMHHLLTRKLIETYLAKCSSESRTQLLFTTHDALLFDADLLRRDETWLVEKNNGDSTLSSISDFKVNQGQNLLYSYLYGCFGGIPRIR